MGFVLDYETEYSEQIFIKASAKDCDAFLKNYTRFGWVLQGKTSISDGLYRLSLKRSKQHPNLNELHRLENQFQALSDKICVKYGKVSKRSDRIDPDYLDYDSPQAFAKEKKLTAGTIVLNTVLCFTLIGFLMWLDTFKALTIDNKKAKEYAEIKAQCQEIFRKAEALV